MWLSVVQGGPWTRVLEARLEDAPMQQQTFSFAPDSLTEIPAARFLRFEVVSCHGGCGGLSYVTVRNSRGRRSRRAAPWPAPVSHYPCDGSLPARGGGQARDQQANLLVLS